MVIHPTEADYLKWSQCIPKDGDLVFLSNQTAAHFNRSTYKPQRKEEAKSLWTLNARSWYGYSLGNAAYFLWLPTGALEMLDKSLLDLLGAEQLRLGVPTVVRQADFLQLDLLKFSDGYWLSSSSWARLPSATEQVLFMKTWAAQNEVPEYESFNFENLPQTVQYELSRIGLKELLNRFCEHSGPNCFAAVAAAILADKSPWLAWQWMHWPDLLEHLERLQYQFIGYQQKPVIGDVLIFLKDEKPVHAAYFLGEGYYFEKAGQNFYSPYRIDLFENWQLGWSDTHLAIWRKNRKIE